MEIECQTKVQQLKFENTKASIKAFFSGKPMHFLNLPIAFSWEPAFLHSADT